MILAFKNVEAPGDIVVVKKNGNEYKGTVMPGTDEQTIVIKLENGYNIGIKREGAEVRILAKGKPPGKFAGKLDTSFKEDLPKVALLSTGGTIASRVDYTTGAVVAEFTVEDFLLSFPEIKDLAKIEMEQIMNVFSEDMEPEYWVKIAKSVAKYVGKVDGVVVTHGTDTMHYTAAALSFFLQGLPCPVVLTGAQRSSDRPSSDAAVNLLNAINVAGYSGLKGVFVVMHENMSDNWCAIHPGTRVRKMHTSRRDTFRTIGRKVVGRSYVLARKGEVEEKKIEIFDESWVKNGGKFEINTKINKNVFLLKFFPGMDKNLFEKILLGHDGVIIEGTGLGHVGNKYIECIERAVKEGVFVGVTSQTIYGRVHPHVYSTAVRMAEAGAVYLEDMLPETALVKLMWALGNAKDQEQVKKIMLTNIAGEITESSDPRCFP